MITPKYLVGIPNSTDTERQFGKYTPTMIGGCGLGAKFCLTLATPWTVANQAPLTLGFSRQEYWSGLHFLLQCMKVKRESEVAQSCPTLSGPMDWSLPGSTVHGIFQAKVLEWGAIAFSDSLLK